MAVGKVQHVTHELCTEQQVCTVQCGEWIQQYSRSEQLMHHVNLYAFSIVSVQFEANSWCIKQFNRSIASTTLPRASNQAPFSADLTDMTLVSEDLKKPGSFQLRKLPRSLLSSCGWTTVICHKLLDPVTTVITPRRRMPYHQTYKIRYHCNKLIFRSSTSQLFS